MCIPKHATVCKTLMLVHWSECDWTVVPLGKGVLTLTRPVEYRDVVGGELVLAAHSY